MPEFRPSTAHQSLGDTFYDVVAPAQFPTLTLRHRNQRWAERIGLGDLTEAQWLEHFGRFAPLPGSLAQPLALRYHGHQFQTYNPDLGDGRGFLFAQAHDLVDGRLLDLATKGSGTTPWSRRADGRLTLKGGVREVLATEMLEALGVDTSKSFSLTETGESLNRHDEPSPTRGSVLVRLSHSHIRIGSFQRLAYLKDQSGLATLLDYAIRTYMPDCWRDERDQRTAAFLERVARNVARTGARWIAAGFVHGVLNTDNINITGESFDYGPGGSCRPTIRRSPPPTSTKPAFMPSAGSPTPSPGTSPGSPNACCRCPPSSCWSRPSTPSGRPSAPKSPRPFSTAWVSRL